MVVVKRKTVIGDNVVVGGNAWITSSMEANAKVLPENPTLRYMRHG